MGFPVILVFCLISSSAQSSISVVEKFRSLKSFLKVWNQESFGSVDLQIEVSTELLNDLDEQGGRHMEPEVLVATRRQLQGNLWRLLKCRTSIWRHNRAPWLREGDCNMRFLQQAAKIRGPLGVLDSNVAKLHAIVFALEL
ncbi:hypothetical protein V6N11_054791 [Hibiscus sabdariffa]|uniref:Uncharacterized protein n=1 Tax=Hibiscus sabdariffa TaxID=183260 RepID=A0ABR2S5V2_9ROSI